MNWGRDVDELHVLRVSVLSVMVNVGQVDPIRLAGAGEVEDVPEATITTNMNNLVMCADRCYDTLETWLRNNESKEFMCVMGSGKKGGRRSKSSSLPPTDVFDAFARFYTMLWRRSSPDRECWPLEGSSSCG